MSRAEGTGRPAVGIACFALLGIAVAIPLAPARGQPMGAVSPPGRAVVGGEAPIVEPPLPPEVQVVRFSGPEGMRVEVLGPPTEPVPVGDGEGLLTVGMRVGVGYRLRLSNLPNQPEGELFPVVEVVGHLHRPPDLDAGRFPIRVVFTQQDLDDVLAFGKLVTQIVYLEEPEQAIPIELPKDEIPIVTLDPAEEPLKVATALGRVMAIVRLGGRAPMPGEPLLSSMSGTATGPCPFAGMVGGRCGLPCGPARLDMPAQGQGRPWLPRDEYLCDGGDHGAPLSFGLTGEVQGVDPRDALLLFNDTRRPRILPTNTVCLYAPRFAMVRTAVGANVNLTVLAPVATEKVEMQVTTGTRQGANRLIRNQAPEAARQRARASALTGKTFAGEHIEIRVLQGVDVKTSVATRELFQNPQTVLDAVKAVVDREVQGPVPITTAEGPVVTGIAEGAGQTVMSWHPQELAGVELPPDQPGLAVIKQVDAGVAEPGEEVTFIIHFRNIGNVPILDVSVIDSLLPRLAYIEGSARGPQGTIFTAAENLLGSTELRWDLPEPLAPGAEGSVSFRARVR
ncbi:hypothetical protein BH23PLA1_BH23PLA1_42960 [soil metagenome]